MNIYQTKKKKYSSSNENMLFYRNTDETVWKPPHPISKRTPLSTNPPISEQFFHDPLLCPNFKNQNPPPPNFRGEETILLLNKPTYVAMCILDLSSN